MAEPHRTYDQQQHVESHAPYGTVFFVLLNLTALEYLYASFYESSGVTRGLMLLGAALVLTLGTVVASRLLHLPFSRGWVYLSLVPAVVLSFLPLGLLTGLLALAIIKASLVGLFFMHLKFEGNWVYYMLLPAAFLAAVFVLALYPDIAMQPGIEAEFAEPDDDETLPVAASPSP